MKIVKRAILPAFLLLVCLSLPIVDAGGFANVLVTPIEHLDKGRLSKSEILEVRAGYQSALAVLKASGMDLAQSPALRMRSLDGSEGVVPAGEYFYEVRFINEKSQLAYLVFVSERSNYAKVVCSSPQECLTDKRP